MNFEQRSPPSLTRSVTVPELKEGAVYFAVNYIDDEMLIPIMETLVFIGRDLNPGDSGLVYFQDVGSYLRGIRHETASEEDYVYFLAGSENEVSHIFEYDHALERLIQCAIRRKEKAGGLTDWQARSKAP